MFVLHALELNVFIHGALKVSILKTVHLCQALGHFSGNYELVD